LETAVPKVFLEQYLQKNYDYSLMAELMRQVEDSINRLSEGRIYQKFNAATSFPTGTTVAYQVGDQVPNISPTELGSAGSKYLIVGWVCIGAGTPGTWREMRTLTGN
jgi:hypothetical protein